KDTKFVEGDGRANRPLFQGELFLKSLEKVEKLKAFAAERGRTVDAASALRRKVAMAQILGFGHVAINVRNWDKTQHFYCELLGLEFAREVQTGKGFSLVYAPLPGGGTLEFRRPDTLGSTSPSPHQAQPAPSPAPSGASQESPIRHFALAVDDVEIFRARLVAAGAPVVMDVADMPHLGMKVFLVEDPNGAVVELTQTYA
ncbi:MAG: VOC family protein, partial [Firmicutes bacterium]|nr:VOC family protein [Bacillota bacterium]